MISTIIQRQRSSFLWRALKKNRALHEKKIGLRILIQPQGKHNCRKLVRRVTFKNVENKNKFNTSREFSLKGTTINDVTQKGGVGGVSLFVTQVHSKEKDLPPL